MMHDGAFEAMVYHQKVTQLLDELKSSQMELLGGIFKKFKSVVEPLAPPKLHLKKQESCP